MIASTRSGAVNYRDFVYLGIIAALALIFFFSFFSFQLPPVEDAAMLMRYAQHTASGQGIVWNIGEPPVDGATDFLFMIFVAFLIKVGFTAEFSVSFLVITAHILTTLTIYFGTRYLFNVARPLAAIAALALALGPGLNYVTAYFGTPFFAFFVTFAWFLSLAYCFHGRRRSLALALAICLLIASLIRPEGVFISLFIIFAIIYLIGFRSSLDILWYTFLVFSTFGSLYFFWHWHYFGYPLPNPFYRKGGGAVYPNSLVASWENTLTLTLPFLAFWLLPLKTPMIRRLKGATLFPLVGFSMIWVLLSSEMNYFYRFQYILLPITLLVWPVLAQSVFGRINRWHNNFVTASAYLFLSILTISSFVTCLYFQHLDPRHRNLNQDGRYQLALALAPYETANYTLVTTEAGILPFYSKWRAIDAWGLNDKYIAHHGAITTDYLSQNKPAIIFLHQSKAASPTPSSRFSWLPDTAAWPNMIETLADYAHSHDYTLAANWGTSPDNTHLYYVNKNLPHHDDLVSLIRNTPYAWYANGQSAINYLNDQ